MIVSKEQEQKFLIKKHCWLIEHDSGGDYKMVYAAVYWKEGMELFESREECEAALNQRIEIRMASGRCPGCNFKSLDRTTRDITHLELIKRIATGSFYLCDSCETTWFKSESHLQAFAYDHSIAPYIMDWAERALTASSDHKEMLDKIGNISNTETHRIYPAHITLINGFELTHALIRLDPLPPASYWFKRRDWHYLDQVKEIKPSKYAYPYSIARFITSDPNTFIFIKSDTSDDILRFEPSAGVFMPEELTSQHFELVKASDIDYSSRHIKVIYEVAERGGSDLWSYTPPPKPVIVWGSF